MFKCSRAAFAGARIILRQVSPESEIIFDLILILYKQCNGDFRPLFNSLGLSSEDLDFFLDYAAMVLDNMGNYRVSTPSTQSSAFAKTTSSQVVTESSFLEYQRSHSPNWPLVHPKPQICMRLSEMTFMTQIRALWATLVIV